MYNATSTDLTIASVTKSDAGVYQCKAVNQAGVDLSQEVEVTVMAETETTCPDEPIELMHPLGKQCQEEEVWKIEIKIRYIWTSYEAQHGSLILLLLLLLLL